jgi:hypothetical protein
MAGFEVDTRTIFMVVLVVAVLLGGAYILNPSYTKRMLRMEGFESGSSTLSADANYTQEVKDVDGETQMEEEEANPNIASFEDMKKKEMKETKEGFEGLGEGPAQFGSAEAPAGCYPRDQLTPSELLPKDPNSVWAQQNPMGTGSLKGKNFLSAGALIGVNTVGQSLRNANYQLRSEPPNPQVAVSVFNQTTIEPDVNRRTMEIN